MFFVSSILLGKDAMWHVTKFFEGYHLRPRHALAGVVRGGRGHRVVCRPRAAGGAQVPHQLPPVPRLHADHKNDMRHGDTTLWWWQVITGFALFFLASVHLYIMLTQPETIGPYGSADRMWTDRMWPLYLVLLFAVELHGGIGLYRLMQKWGWFAGPTRTPRAPGSRPLKWALTVFFLVLGLATLAAYVKIGIEHAPHAGQHYTPAWLQPGAK
jgi:fumarate reductase subunit C